MHTKSWTVKEFFEAYPEYASIKSQFNDSRYIVRTVHSANNTLELAEFGFLDDEWTISPNKSKNNPYKPLKR